MKGQNPITHFKVGQKFKIYSSMHSKFDSFGVIGVNNSAVWLYDVFFGRGCFDLRVDEYSVWDREKYLECYSARSYISNSDKSGRSFFGDIIKKDEIIRVDFNVCRAKGVRLVDW